MEMIHLITVAGQSARNFYLEQGCISNFKALMRTVTSGRVMIVSTKFRSDLFYSADQPTHEAILKLWALYANTDWLGLVQEDISTFVGRETSFTHYFQSIDRLSTNWYLYRLYQRAFYQTFSDDEQNPVTMVVLGCDQHLVNHPSIKREPLLDVSERIGSELSEDTFSIAMHIINNETHAN